MFKAIPRVVLPSHHRFVQQTQILIPTALGRKRPRYSERRPDIEDSMLSSTTVHNAIDAFAYMKIPAWHCDITRQQNIAHIYFICQNQLTMFGFQLAT